MESKPDWNPLTDEQLQDVLYWHREGYSMEVISQLLWETHRRNFSADMLWDEIHGVGV